MQCTHQKTRQKKPSAVVQGSETIGVVTDAAVAAAEGAVVETVGAVVTVVAAEVEVVEIEAAVVVRGRLFAT